MILNYRPKHKKKREKGKMKICRDEFCENKVFAQGYCWGHYQTSGVQIADIKFLNEELNKQICIDPMCGKEVFYMGFCWDHWLGSGLPVPGELEKRGYIYETI